MQVPLCVLYVCRCDDVQMVQSGMRDGVIGEDGIVVDVFECAMLVNECV
jgi:hypothetical protein